MMMHRAILSGLTVAALALAGSFAGSEAWAGPKDAKCRHGKGECPHHKGGKHGKKCDCKKCDCKKCMHTKHKGDVEAKTDEAEGAPSADAPPPEKPAEAPAGE